MLLMLFGAGQNDYDRYGNVRINVGHGQTTGICAPIDVSQKTMQEFRSGLQDERLCMSSERDVEAGKLKRRLS